MAEWSCEECGNRFVRDKAGARPIRFCGQPCYHIWNKREGQASGRFQSGNIPWTLGKKGIRLSPETEFKPGQESSKRVAVGSITVRHRKREKHPRAFVKTKNPNTWREMAKVVWEDSNGPIPKGMIIHHKDRNPLNDGIENLQMMTRSEHLAEHRGEHLAVKRITAAHRQADLFVAKPAVVGPIQDVLI